MKKIITISFFVFIALASIAILVHNTNKHNVTVTETIVDPAVIDSIENLIESKKAKSSKLTKMSDAQYIDWLHSYWLMDRDCSCYVRRLNHQDDAEIDQFHAEMAAAKREIDLETDRLKWADWNKNTSKDIQNLKKLVDMAKAKTENMVVELESLRDVILLEGELLKLGRGKLDSQRKI